MSCGEGGLWLGRARNLSRCGGLFFPSPVHRDDVMIRFLPPMNPMSSGHLLNSAFVASLTPISIPATVDATAAIPFRMFLSPSDVRIVRSVPLKAACAESGNSG